VKSDLTSFNDQALVRATWFDALGRVRLTKQLEQASDDVNNNSYGIKVLTRYYTPPSSGTSFQLVSNPYVSGNEGSMGWTRTKFDTNGRPVEAVHFNGPASSLPYPWGGNSSSTGTVATSYASNTVTTTDEAGVSRTSSVDGLGRMTQVNESGITVVLVTHELDIAARAHRRIMFRDGLIVEDTSVEDTRVRDASVDEMIVEAAQ